VKSPLTITEMRKLDPAIGKLSPVFDDRHVAGSRVFAEDFARLRARIFHREREGFAQEAVGIEPAKVAEFPRSLSDVPWSLHGAQLLQFEKEQPHDQVRGLQAPQTENSSRGLGNRSPKRAGTFGPRSGSILGRTIAAAGQWRLANGGNKPVGDNARKGAVKKRTQRKTKLTGKTTWTKRSTKSGRFVEQKKAPAKKKFKGVRKER